MKGCVKMNKCILTGRIVRDPELKETKTGKNICKFTIATNEPTRRDGETVTDFVECVVWDKQAENLCKYQTKGNLIAVVGELRVDNYEVEGKKVKRTYVLANNIEFLEKKNEFEQASIKTEFQAGKEIEISDSELPW